MVSFEEVESSILRRCHYNTRKSQEAMNGAQYLTVPSVAVPQVPACSMMLSATGFQMQYYGGQRTIYGKPPRSAMPYYTTLAEPLPSPTFLPTPPIPSPLSLYSRSTQFFPQAIHQPFQIHTQKAIPSGDAAVALLSLQEAVVHEGSPTASTPIIKKDPLTPPSCGKLTTEEPDSSTSTCTNTPTDQGYISRESVSLAPEEYDFAETPHGQATPFSIYQNPRPHFSHASCLPRYAPVSYPSHQTLLHAPPYIVETFPRNNSCHICGKTYARQSTLKTHLRTHNGEKPYQCSICQKSFTQAANLTAHLRTHSGEKPFKCPVCNRGFSQSSSVTTHMRTHSGERPYKCNVCGKGFADSSTLTKHYRTHTGEKPYQCKICDARFSQSGNLNRHMRTHRNHFQTRSQ